MSLMSTLTKVAVGIIVAKGVQQVTRSMSTTTRSGGVTTSTHRTTQTRRYAPDAGSMGGIMDEILNAGKTTARRSTTGRSGTGRSGGLDDLLGSSRSTSRTRKTAPSGGLESILAGKSGGLGDLLGAVLGGGAMAGGMSMDKMLRDQTMPDPHPQHQDEAEAAVLLRAMIMAAKCDGQLDQDEKAHLTQAAGDATQAEIDFINRELAAPVDIDSLLQDVPRGMEEKVYTVSLVAITLDQRVEAEYLDKLANALGLHPAEVNAIHDNLQAPRIYD